MYTKLALIVVMILGMLMPLTVVGEDDKPTIALLRYRQSSGSNTTIKAIWDMFQAYGYISLAERTALNVEEDIDGEHINVFFRNAGGDLPTANIMVEEALDRGADVMLTISTPVSSIATKAALEMEDPPYLFFSLVSTPYTGGIASSPCIKPDFVAGTHAKFPYDLIVPLLQVQNPDITTFGTYVNAAEANSVTGSKLIVERGEELGMTVEVAPLVSSADLVLATETLLDKGVEAILYPAGYIELFGTSTIAGIAQPQGVPVFGPALVLPTSRGAMVGAGFRDYYDEGVIVARLLLAHLEGTQDISKLAINTTLSLGVSINLDAAAEGGIEVAEGLLEMAEYVIEDGQSTADDTPPSLPEMSLEERRAEDAAFLAELECTPERIAAEQAALDAADG
ncbi:MAG: hypothetical protein F4X02_13875 [Chloroflexi bacterium]|nr:hypothetical protein [Chloroflexota bacterium]